MPDINAAMEVIDFYIQYKLDKPDASMKQSFFIYCCQRIEAAELLRKYLIKHWNEAPAADLVFLFIKDRKRLKNRLKNDVFQKIVYDVAKDIFYYFI